MGWRPWRRHQATVVYRNGVVLKFWCSELTVRRTMGSISGLEWDRAKPRPLHIGVDEIAAVWVR